MEALRLEKRKLEKEFVKHLAESRAETEAYFDRIAEDSWKLGQYQSSNDVQSISYFDANI